MFAPSNSNSTEAFKEPIDSSPLRHLLALGESLGARSQVLYATTEQGSTLSRISFTFDDNMPFCSCDPLESIRMDNTRLADSSPPSFPPSSAISTTTTVCDNALGSITDDGYSDTLDFAYNALDISDAEATIVDGIVLESPAPAALTLASSSAPAALRPLPVPIVSYDERWYAVMIGKEIGIFCGWSNTAPHVLGVSGAYYKDAADQATAQAIYDFAFAARKVSVVL